MAEETVEQKKSLWRRWKLWQRILCIALACIVGIVAVLGLTFVSVWHNEISTVNSFTKLRDRDDAHKDGAVYKMTVKGGFYFDDYLKSGGASSDTELINFITNHITRGLIDMTIKETDIGCSAFTAQAENGDRLFGRNYDFAKTNVCITLCNNPGKGRYKSFSTVDLNYVGMDTETDVTGAMNKITCLAAPYAPLDGINEKGVSCGIFMSYQGDVDGDPTLETVATDQKHADRNNITSTTMLRMILDYAANVDEAVELVKKYNLHDSANTSFHYMIADASGKSALLEWIPTGEPTVATDRDGSARELVVTYNTDSMYANERGDTTVDYQWITNFIVHDHEKYYAGQEKSRYGYDRYTDINTALKATGGVLKDEQAAMDILASVGRRTYKEGGGVTVHSAVFNLTKKTVLWVANERYSDKTAYYEYSVVTGKLKQLG